MKKKWIIVIIIVISILAIIIINRNQINKSVAVQVDGVQEGVIQETIFASGKLNPMDETLQHTEHNGLIKQLDIQLGDHVVVGQTLLLMDTEEMETQLLNEENNKQMIAMERSIFRNQKLADAKQQLQDGVSAQTILDPEQLELYDLRLKVVELSMVAIEKRIAANRLLATAEGVVTDILVKKGQVVGEGTPAFTIVDDSRLRVKAYLNELDANKVNVGMDAKITGDAFTDSYSGKVSYLSPVAVPVDATSRDVAVELWVDLDTTDAQLRPGYNATVEIQISQTPSLLAPLTAIRHIGDKTIVFMIEDGRAVEREVTTGDDDGERIEIQTGLQVGDEIISELTNDVATGNKVEEQ